MQKANHFKLKPTPKLLDEKKSGKPSVTEEISSKMTSPTLIAFRNQNSQVPEWRLQLQNAVQQRLKSDDQPAENSDRRVAAVAPSEESAGKAGENSGATDSSIPRTENKYLDNALKRIESSRKRYLIPEPETRKRDRDTAAAETKKDYPFTIAARNEKEGGPPPDTSTREEVSAAKPKLVARNKKLPIKDLYDTSELNPEFPPAKLSSSFGSRRDPEPGIGEIKIEARDRSTGRVPEPESESASKAEPAAPAKTVEETTAKTAVVDEYDDYASIGLRLNAGIFDFIIGGFLSFVLLLPFIIAGGNWFTFSGILAFLATCSIVMFIYLTTSIGLAGKSFGMHIFSLEMIDIGGENYPSFHQSAVSAAVYLVSVAFFGIGFVTALFDEDRRAAHDLLSGTLVVREL